MKRCLIAAMPFVIDLMRRDVCTCLLLIEKVKRELMTDDVQVSEVPSDVYRTMPRD
jgi:hypothetical protein